MEGCAMELNPGASAAHECETDENTSGEFKDYPVFKQKEPILFNSSSAEDTHILISNQSKTDCNNPNGAHDLQFVTSITCTRETTGSLVDDTSMVISNQNPTDSIYSNTAHLYFESSLSCIEETVGIFVEGTNVTVSSRSPADYLDSNAAHDLQFETSIACARETAGSFVDDTPMVLSNQNTTGSIDSNAAHHLPFESAPYYIKESIGIFVEDTHPSIISQNRTDCIESSAAHNLESETSINCTTENGGSFVEDAPMIISNENATDYTDLNGAHDLQFETAITCTRESIRSFEEDAPMIISNQNTTDYTDSICEPHLQFETSITCADGHIDSFDEGFLVIISNQNTTDSFDSNGAHDFQYETSVSCTKEVQETQDSMSTNGLEEDTSKSCNNKILVTEADEDKEVEAFDLTRLDLEIGSQICPLVGHTDIERTLPLGSFVPIQEVKEILLSEDSSSDSESDTDSSSSSSSPTSSSVASVSLSSLLLDAEEDDDLMGKDGKGFPVTPKEVLQLDVLPPVEDLNIILPEEVDVKPFGVVSTIFDHLVIIESYCNLPVLCEGSVVFKEDRSPVGEIFEIFGPTPRPCYLVRFNSSEHIEAHGIQVANVMCYAPNVKEYTDFLLTEKLKHFAGLSQRRILSKILTRISLTLKSPVTLRVRTRTLTRWPHAENLGTEKLKALGMNGEVFPAIQKRHNNAKDAICMYRKKVATKCSSWEKGSDASWANDIEPPADVLDYSDDEKEKEAKQQKKALQEGRKKLRTEKNENGNPQVAEKQCPQWSSSTSQAPNERPGFMKKRLPHKSQRDFRPARNSYDSQHYSGSQWTPQEEHPTKTWHQGPQCFSRYRNGIPATQEHDSFHGQMYNPSCETTWQYPPPPPMNTNVSWHEQNMAPPQFYDPQYSLMLPPPPPLPPPIPLPPPPLPSHGYPSQSMYNSPYPSMPPPTPPHPPYSAIPQFPPMPPTLPPPPNSYSHNPSFPSMPPPFTSMPPPLSPQQPVPLSSDHPLFFSLFQPPPPPPSSPPPEV